MTDATSAPTPPHHSELSLQTLTEDGFEDYFTAVARGFHEDFHADDLAVERPVIEADRCFGFRAGDRWVSTALSFPRTMAVPGGSVDTAAVTVVTVAPGFRRKGLLTQMMRHQLTDIAARGREALTLLWATESLIYGRFGYGQATRRLGLSGLTREMTFLPGVDLGAGSTDEVGAGDFLAAAGPLREKIFTDRPGHLNRTDDWWRVVLYDPERQRNGASPIRYALHFAADGTPDGYATFRTKRDSSLTELGGEVIIGDIEATDPASYAALWRWLLDLDLVRAFRRSAAPTDEPLPRLVSNPRLIKAELTDASYARIVDVPAALQARTYACDLELVLEVEDAFLPDLGGRFRLTGGSDGAAVQRTDASPDLTLTARELATLYLGDTSARDLARAGWLKEHSAGAIDRLSLAFTGPRAPFCPDFF